ncbi:MAG: hypothetical protein OXF73_06970 [Gammaproteobacteria bacterium]|nr:hypothetical protein [Gammaproteobacteria bacterium]MCY4226382.1 hypothetical protein [Gammaproteobacteria bacterium]
MQSELRNLSIVNSGNGVQEQLISVITIDAGTVEFHDILHGVIPIINDPVAFCLSGMP